ncbi:MAG TPA: DinB family protein [Pyrinomonadaceae bacterium]|nr:DinB family protein [Pyrinomonadaceae bacterium]
MTNELTVNQKAGGTEAWLLGPLSDTSFMLTPAAHALMQAAIDIERAASALTVEEVWRKPAGAPSVGFHLRHVAGSIDRLLTYARGGQLSAEQFRALATESEPGDAAEEAVALIRMAKAHIEDALQVLRTTTDTMLAEPREVGRSGLPSTVFGLLFHIAEHTQRHTGQIVTTARIVRGISSGEENQS